MSILTVERLGKTYSGFEAVSDVSFALEAGEMLALIGPNGAGKGRESAGYRKGEPLDAMTRQPDRLGA